MRLMWMEIQLALSLGRSLGFRYIPLSPLKWEHKVVKTLESGKQFQHSSVSCIKGSWLATVLQTWQCKWNKWKGVMFNFYLGLLQFYCQMFTNKWKTLLLIFQDVQVLWSSIPDPKSLETYVISFKKIGLWTKVHVLPSLQLSRLSILLSLWGLKTILWKLVALNSITMVPHCAVTLQTLPIFAMILTVELVELPGEGLIP